MADEVFQVTFGVKGGSDVVKGETGKGIKKDLEDIASQIHPKIKFEIDKDSANNNNWGGQIQRMLDNLSSKTGFSITIDKIILSQSAKSGLVKQLQSLVNSVVGQNVNIVISSDGAAQVKDNLVQIQQTAKDTAQSVKQINDAMKDVSRTARDSTVIKRQRDLHQIAKKVNGALLTQSKRFRETEQSANSAHATFRKVLAQKAKVNSSSTSTEKDRRKEQMVVQRRADSEYSNRLSGYSDIIARSEEIRRAISESLNGMVEESAFTGLLEILEKVRGKSVETAAAVKQIYNLASAKAPDTLKTGVQLPNGRQIQHEEKPKSSNNAKKTEQVPQRAEIESLVSVVQDAKDTVKEVKEEITEIKKISSSKTAVDTLNVVQKGVSEQVEASRDIAQQEVKTSVVIQQEEAKKQDAINVTTQAIKEQAEAVKEIGSSGQDSKSVVDARRTDSQDKYAIYRNLQWPDLGDREVGSDALDKLSKDIVSLSEKLDDIVPVEKMYALYEGAVEGKYKATYALEDKLSDILVDLTRRTGPTELLSAVNTKGRFIQKAFDKVRGVDIINKDNVGKEPDYRAIVGVSKDVSSAIRLIDTAIKMLEGIKYRQKYDYVLSGPQRIESLQRYLASLYFGDEYGSKTSAYEIKQLFDGLGIFNNTEYNYKEIMNLFDRIAGDRLVQDNPVVKNIKGILSHELTDALRPAYIDTLDEIKQKDYGSVLSNIVIDYNKLYKDNDNWQDSFVNQIKELLPLFDKYQELVDVLDRTVSIGRLSDLKDYLRQIERLQKYEEGTVDEYGNASKSVFRMKSRGRITSVQDVVQSFYDKIAAYADELNVIGGEPDWEQIKVARTLPEDVKRIKRLFDLVNPTDSKTPATIESGHKAIYDYIAAPLKAAGDAVKEQQDISVNVEEKVTESQVKQTEAVDESKASLDTFTKAVDNATTVLERSNAVEVQGQAAATQTTVPQAIASAVTNLNEQSIQEVLETTETLIQDESKLSSEVEDTNSLYSRQLQILTEIDEIARQQTGRGMFKKSGGALRWANTGELGTGKSILEIEGILREYASKSIREPDIDMIDELLSRYSLRQDMSNNDVFGFLNDKLNKQYRVKLPTPSVPSSVEMKLLDLIKKYVLESVDSLTFEKKGTPYYNEFTRERKKELTKYNLQMEVDGQVLNEQLQAYQGSEELRRKLRNKGLKSIKEWPVKFDAKDFAKWILGQEGIPKDNELASLLGIAGKEDYEKINSIVQTLINLSSRVSDMVHKPLFRYSTEFGFDYKNAQLYLRSKKKTATQYDSEKAVYDKVVEMLDAAGALYRDQNGMVFTDSRELAKLQNESDVSSYATDVLKKFADSFHSKSGAMIKTLFDEIREASKNGASIDQIIQKSQLSSLDSKKNDGATNIIQARDYSKQQIEDQIKLDEKIANSQVKQTEVINASKSALDGLNKSAERVIDSGTVSRNVEDIATQEAKFANQVSETNDFLTRQIQLLKEINEIYEKRTGDVLYNDLNLKSIAKEAAYSKTDLNEIKDELVRYVTSVPSSRSGTFISSLRQYSHNGKKYGRDNFKYAVDRAIDDAYYVRMEEPSGISSDDLRLLEILKGVLTDSESKKQVFLLSKKQEYGSDANGYQEYLKEFEKHPDKDSINQMYKDFTKLGTGIKIFVNDLYSIYNEYKQRKGGFSSSDRRIIESSGGDDTVSSFIRMIKQLNHRIYIGSNKKRWPLMIDDYAREIGEPDFSFYLRSANKVLSRRKSYRDRYRNEYNLLNSLIGRAGHDRSYTSSGGDSFIDARVLYGLKDDKTYKKYIARTIKENQRLFDFITSNQEQIKQSGNQNIESANGSIITAEALVDAESKSSKAIQDTTAALQEEKGETDTLKASKDNLIIALEKSNELLAEQKELLSQTGGSGGGNGILGGIVTSVIPEPKQGSTHGSAMSNSRRRQLALPSGNMLALPAYNYSRDEQVTGGEPNIIALTDGSERLKSVLAEISDKTKEVADINNKASESINVLTDNLVHEQDQLSLTERYLEKYRNAILSILTKDNWTLMDVSQITTPSNGALALPPGRTESPTALYGPSQKEDYIPAERENAQAVLTSLDEAAREASEKEQMAVETAHEILQDITYVFSKMGKVVPKFNYNAVQDILVNDSEISNKVSEIVSAAKDDPRGKYQSLKSVVVGLNNYANESLDRNHILMLLEEIANEYKNVELAASEANKEIEKTRSVKSTSPKPGSVGGGSSITGLLSGLIPPDQGPPSGGGGGSGGGISNSSGGNISEDMLKGYQYINTIVIQMRSMATDAQNLMRVLEEGVTPGDMGQVADVSAARAMVEKIADLRSQIDSFKDGMISTINGSLDLPVDELVQLQKQLMRQGDVTREELARANQEAKDIFFESQMYKRQQDITSYTTPYHNALLSAEQTFSGIQKSDLSQEQQELYDKLAQQLADARTNYMKLSGGSYPDKESLEQSLILMREQQDDLIRTKQAVDDLKTSWIGLSGAQKEQQQVDLSRLSNMISSISSSLRQVGSSEGYLSNEELNKYNDFLEILLKLNTAYLQLKSSSSTDNALYQTTLSDSIRLGQTTVNELVGFMDKVTAYHDEAERIVSVDKLQRPEYIQKQAAFNTQYESSSALLRPASAEFDRYLSMMDNASSHERELIQSTGEMLAKAQNDLSLFKQKQIDTFGSVEEVNTYGNSVRESVNAAVRALSELREELSRENGAFTESAQKQAVLNVVIEQLTSRLKEYKKTIKDMSHVVTSGEDKDQIVGILVNLDKVSQKIKEFKKTDVNKPGLFAEDIKSQASMLSSSMDDVGRQVDQLWNKLHEAGGAYAEFNAKSFAYNAGKSQIKSMIDDATKLIKTLDALKERQVGGLSQGQKEILGSTIKPGFANLQSDYAAYQAKNVQSFSNVDAINAEINAIKERNFAWLESAKSMKAEIAGDKERYNAMRQGINLMNRMKKAQQDWSAARYGKSFEDYSKIEGYITNLSTLLSNFQAQKISVEDFRDQLSKLNADFAKSSAVIKDNNENHKSFAGTLRRVTQAFSYMFSATRIIMTITRNIREMINTTIQLGDKMTQLQIVTRRTNATMTTYMESVKRTAKELGVSMSDLIDATTTFARLGYSIEDSSLMAELTGMLEKVGSIDASSAQDSITSIIKAFNIPVNDIEEIMDKLVITGNSFPISVSQIAEGMTNASSALAASGNTFEESVALLTAANTTVQNASKSSTGLRTIAARIRNTKTELDELGEEALSSAKYNELVSALTKQGVSLVDQTGEFRSTYDIIKDIADVWDDMTSMEQAGLANALAGTRQQAIFFSLVEQFKEAEGAMDAMQGSAGELERSYSYYMDSTTAHINQMKAATQSLGSTIFDTDTMNLFVDFATGIANIANIVMKLINVFGGLRTILLTIATIVMTIKAESIAAFGTSIVKSIANIGVTIKDVTLKLIEMSRATNVFNVIRHPINSIQQSMRDLQTGAGAASTALSVMQTKFLLVGIAVSAIVSAISIFVIKQRQARQELAETTQVAHDNAKSLDSLIERYEKLYKDGTIDADSMEEAKTIQSELEELLGSQANRIDIVNGKYKDQLEILREIQKVNAQKSKPDIEEEYNIELKEAKDTAISEADFSRMYELTDLLRNMSALGYEVPSKIAEAVKNGSIINVQGIIEKGSLEDSIELLGQLIELLDSEEYRQYANDHGMDRVGIKQSVQGIYGIFEDAYNGVTAKEDYYRNNAVTLIDNIISGSLGKDTIQSVDEYKSVLEDILNTDADTGQVEAYKTRLAELYPQFAKLVDVAEDGAIGISDFGSSLSEVVEAIDETSSGIDTLNKALIEMGSAGGLSLDTIKALAQADEDFLKYLYVEGDQVKLNTEMLKQYSEEKLRSKLDVANSDLDAVNSQISSMGANTVDALQNYFNIKNNSRLQISPNYANLLKQAEDEIVATGVKQENLTTVEEQYQKALENREGILNDIAVIQQILNDLEQQEYTNNSYSVLGSLEGVDKSVKMISDAMAEFKDDGKASISAISGLFETFGNYESFGEFAKALSNSGSSLEQVRAAANRLGTEYIRDIGILDQVDEENAELVETMLESIGVTNAHEVVQQKLIPVTQQLLAIQTAEKANMLGLADAEWAETEAKLRQNGANEEAIAALQAYRIEVYKTAVMSMDLAGATDSVIKELVGLGEQAGLSAKSLSPLIQMMSLVNEMNTKSQTGELNGKDFANYQRKLDLLKKQAEDAANVEVPEYTVAEFDFSTSYPDAESSSAAKDAVEEYIAEIDKFREAIERLDRVRLNEDKLQAYIDGNQDLEDQIEYSKQMVELLNQEQTAMHALAEERRAYISQQVDKLRNMGFNVDWDPERNTFFVHNLEHINDLVASNVGEYDSLQEATNELRKDTEELVNELEGYNDENQELSSKWFENHYKIFEEQISIFENTLKQEENALQLMQTHLNNSIEGSFDSTHLEAGQVSWESLGHAVGESTENVKAFSAAISGLPDATRDSLMERGMANYNAALAEYDALIQKAESMGIDLSRTLYGNIDMANRQVLDWTAASIEQFRDEIESWGVAAEDLAGSTGDALSGTMEIEGNTVAFTPVLQTEDGPVLLSRDMLYHYIAELIRQIEASGGEWHTEDLLQLDIDGLFVDGQYIHGLLAGVGQDANDTAEALALIGSGGEFERLAARLSLFYGTARITADDVEELRKKDSSLNAVMEQNGYTAEEVANMFNTYAASMKIASNRTGELVNSYDDLSSVIGNNSQANAFDELLATAEQGEAVVQHYRQMQQQVHAEAEFYRKAENGGYEENSDQLAELSSKWWEYENAIKDTRDTLINNLEDMISKSNEALDGIQNAYDTMHNAANEYAENGGFLSIDTYQELISLGPEYLVYLRDENGLLQINEQSIRDCIAAKTEQLALDTAISLVERMRLASLGQSNETLDDILFQTQEVTNANWALVYSQLANIDMTDKQREAALDMIIALQALGHNTAINIGKDTGAYREELENMKDGINDLIGYVEDMLKDRLQHIVDSLNEMKEAYSDIIDLKKESLQATKDEQDYQDELSEKIKEMADLQAQINALSLDDSREAQAQKVELEEQMADLQKELADTQADYTLDKQLESLDDQNTAYSEEKDKEIQQLQETLSSEQKLYDAAIEYIRSHYSTLMDELAAYNYECGSVLTSEIVSAWEAASEAARRYGDVVSALPKIEQELSNLDDSSNFNSTVGDTSGLREQAEKYMKDNATANAEAASSIVSQMKRNSMSWLQTDDKSKQSQLKSENQRLASQLSKYGITATYRNDGNWYITKDNNNKKNIGQLLYDCYHTGGIVGDVGTLKENEQVAKLQKGEVVISNPSKKNLYSMIDFASTLSKKFSSALSGAGGASNKLYSSIKDSISNAPANLTNNKNANISFGDVIINGNASDATVEKHRQVTRDFANEILSFLDMKH